MRRKEYGLYIVRDFEGYGEHTHAVEYFSTEERATKYRDMLSEELAVRGVNYKKLEVRRQPARF